MDDVIRPSDILQRADASRDRKAWKTAAEQYGEYLTHHPNDFGAWVQKGNMLKEHGAYGEALAAYRSAEALDRENADLNLQLGHLQKLRGEKGLAIDHYRRSVELDSSSPAFAELLWLDAEPPSAPDTTASVSAVGNRIFLDITDVLLFLEHHTNVTGIQRVIVNIFESMHAKSGGFSDRNITYCYVGSDSNKIREIPPSILHQIFSLLKDGSVSRRILSQALAASRKGHLVRPTRSDIYFILGAFWVSPSYPSLLMSLRADGVSIGLYIYDLIPITNREFVPVPNAVDFATGGIAIIQLSDFVLTISEFVAEEVKDFVQAHMGRTIPVRAVPLAQEFAKFAKTADVSDEIDEVSSSDFVLSVGTIEIRKNHIYLVRIWQHLIATRGFDNVPNLILVGRWGWQVDELKTLLETTHYLHGKVVVLDRVADSELSLLYERCLFTAFPSFVEGWGLPIGESLVYGKLCIASNTTSMPEVGGNFVRYIDPFSLNEGRSAFEWALDHPSEVAEWGQRIEREFHPTTWATVADDLVSRIEEIGLVGDGRDTYATLPRGDVTDFSNIAIRRIGADRPAAFITRLAAISGWHELEDWGVWSSSKTPRLRFRVNEQGPARNYRLGLQLRLASSEGTGNLRVISSGDSASVTILSGKERWYFLDVTAREDGVIDLRLNYSGPAHVDHRNLYLGLSGISIAHRESALERASITESIITRMP